MPNQRPPGFVPGYMKEDLEMREVGGPPRYKSRTDNPVDYVEIADAQGTVIGYLWINDEDDAAGYQPRPDAGATAMNLATPWVLGLVAAKKRDLKPSEALAEAIAKPPGGASHVVENSRTSARHHAALKALAGDTRPYPTGTPTR